MKWDSKNKLTDSELLDLTIKSFDLFSIPTEPVNWRNLLLQPFNDPDFSVQFQSNGLTFARDYFPDEKHPAGNLHDWYYIQQHKHSLTRKQADVILYKTLLLYKFPKDKAKAMYRVVRLFGWLYWNDIFK